MNATANTKIILSKPIPIPTPSNRGNSSPTGSQSFAFQVGSPAFSECESALDEDDNVYDMYHIPSHHRRNALSFEDGFELPVFLHRRMSEPQSPPK